MVAERNRNVVIKSQFNINGSRGADAGAFIANYVSRDSATDTSMAYIPDSHTPPVTGDGVAFTLDATAIPRSETLRLADTVQQLHEEGNRAIQQMVISFDVDYLVEMGIVPSDVPITKKGDYEFNYDDVRLRHAIRSGIQELVDHEGYRDGRMVAAIQHDTLHLHVHAVVYENHPKLARRRGREEKGVIKESSFKQMAQEIDRTLRMTRMGAIPTPRRLLPDKSPHHEFVVSTEPLPDTSYIDIYIQLIREQQESEKLQSQMSAFLDTIEYDESYEMDWD